MEASSAAFGRTRLLHALQHRDFRLLWTGQTISLAGDAAFIVALGWRTFTLTGSPRYLAYVLTLQGVGLLSTLLIGGALADRYNRRTMMIASDLARAGIVGVLVVIDASGHLTFASLAAIAFAEGLAWGFFQPAFGGIVPLVVEPAELPSANALIGISRQASLLLGPAVAGLLYGLAGSAVVFAFEAVTFLVSAALLWRTRPRTAEISASEGTVREVITGFRYVAGVPWLWVSISIFSVVLMLQYAAIQVLVPKLVKQHFGLGVGAYGVLVSLLGGGMILGMLAFVQINPQRRRGVVSYTVWLANSLLVIGLALAPWYALAAAFALGRGAFIGFGNGIWETLLMQRVPQHMLSRVVSLDWFGTFGLTPLGFLLMSAVSGLAPPGATIAAAAGISALLTAFGLTLRSVREID